MLAKWEASRWGIHASRQPNRRFFSQVWLILLLLMGITSSFYFTLIRRPQQLTSPEPRIGADQELEKRKNMSLRKSHGRKGLQKQTSNAPSLKMKNMLEILQESSLSSTNGAPQLKETLTEAKGMEF
ncbi:hypothetical protein HAX54_051377 [Datura stramonium]|uniref:Uncharacterized protein n=1 Tax=Datura stramonium TaxID=4076 RepID=A0ABS8WQ67_DATST|nr:hypothetical protein [Datura stramonium]